MPPNILEIKGLSVDFLSEQQTVHAVQNISLYLNAGEVVALVGESGSGKSVTALSILRLLPLEKNCIAKGNILFYDDPPVDLLSCNDETLRLIRVIK